MLRFLLRAAASEAATASPRIPPALFVALASAPVDTAAAPAVARASKTFRASYATLGKKARATRARKSKLKRQVDPNSLPLSEEERTRLLAEDENNESADVGHGGRPLFTAAPSLSRLTRNDACSYMKFDMDKLEKALPEGLPWGMQKEFQTSLRSALLIRRSFLDLRDNFRRIAYPALRTSLKKGRETQKHVVLDGLVGCGKTIVLAMLVHWARDEGWLVFYVPRGRDWTHGGFRYKNPTTGLWDTPCKATKILQDFLKFNESCLQNLPCHIHEPFPLGEGAGIGWRKDADSIAMPEGSALYDLIQRGLSSTHAAVGAVVRLRKELSLVKDVPVLIAIDEYNSWFTFSTYEEAINIHASRPVHAREVATVNAFRPMMNDEMMVGAFSHSTAVGKLRKFLPDVPVNARVILPRYSLDEAAAVSHYYLRQKMVRPEYFCEESWKKVYYLSNGNGKEVRSLLPLMR